MDTPRVVALGFFDGVHIGHGALLRETRAQADRLGCSAAAMSFDAHPSALLSDAPAPLLGTMEERALLMRWLYGMDEVIFEHFDRAMLELPWQTFLDRYLIEQLHAQYVVCGHDYRFGYRGEGTAALLREACEKRGIGCSIVPQVMLDGVRVSSTEIRTLLERGDAETARRFLGHPHLISGTVEHGQHLGHTLGFPTANIPFAPGILVPPYGVYCARAELDGQSCPAVVNIGIHPTAGSLPAPVLEANLLGCADDLYGKKLLVWLYKMLRPERRFASLEALRTQIASDSDATRAYFAALEG